MFESNLEKKRDITMSKDPTICCIDRCLTKSNAIKVKDIVYYL